ncbi:MULTISPECIES: hypothetical protein [Haloarcula]|uniref:hypothetical protein n=1 Tax=Haloarcula TaxID=2237 RepID=UPI000F8EF9B8|nr:MULTISPECIES: hypothetical protein [Haloarcula]NHX41395.1 hypothetical protein [Haloarcula sp. R1-2]
MKSDSGVTVEEIVDGVGNDVSAATFDDDAAIPRAPDAVCIVAIDDVFVAVAGMAALTVCIEVLPTYLDAEAADELVPDGVCIVVAPLTFVAIGADVVAPEPVLREDVLAIFVADAAAKIAPEAVIVVAEPDTFVAVADFVTESVKSKSRLSEEGAL